MDSTRDPAAIEAIALLKYYGFDLADEVAETFVTRWSAIVPASWVRLAILEALYQGRYKAISVAQLLSLWQRREAPFQHFNFEFERLVCHRLPGMPSPEPEPVPEVESPPVAIEVEATGESFDSLEGATPEPSQTVPKIQPKPPIDRFTPSEARSSLYDKLQHLAQPDPED